MLSFAIADERFQPIGRRRAKIIERRSGIEHLELSFDNRLQVAVPTRPMTFVDTTRLDISERPNQGFRIAVLRSTSSVQVRGCLLSGNPAVAGLMLISRATTERARRLSGSVFDEGTSQPVGWAEAHCELTPRRFSRGGLARAAASSPPSNCRGVRPNARAAPWRSPDRRARSSSPKHTRRPFARDTRD